MFDCAFPVAMDQDGTLFGLFGCVTADVDECLDDIVKSVNVVVPQHQLAATVFKHNSLIFRLGTYVWFVFFHLLIMGFPRIS